jgi:hypothetical protein
MQNMDEHDLINKNGTIKKKFWEEIPTPPKSRNLIGYKKSDFEVQKPSWDDELDYLDHPLEEDLEYESEEESCPNEPDFYDEIPYYSKY